MVLLPVLTALFDHMAVYEFGSDLLSNFNSFNSISKNNDSALYFSSYLHQFQFDLIQFEMDDVENHSFFICLVHAQSFNRVNWN